MRDEPKPVGGQRVVNPRYRDGKLKQTKKVEYLPDDFFVDEAPSTKESA